MEKKFGESVVRSMRVIEKIMTIVNKYPGSQQMTARANSALRACIIAADTSGTEVAKYIIKQVKEWISTKVNVYCGVVFGRTLIQTSPTLAFTQITQELKGDTYAFASCSDVFHSFHFILFLFLYFFCIFL